MIESQRPDGTRHPRAPGFAAQAQDPGILGPKSDPALFFGPIFGPKSGLDPEILGRGRATGIRGIRPVEIPDRGVGGDRGRSGAP
jgi:hypothetical protein